jgi:hypothetical protein
MSSSTIKQYYARQFTNNIVRKVKRAAYHRTQRKLWLSQARALTKRGRRKFRSAIDHAMFKAWEAHETYMVILREIRREVHREVLK